MQIILLIALLCLLLGLWLQRRSQQTAAQLGLPTGEIVYSDTSAWDAVTEPLLSRRYGLVGKPDYLVAVPTATGSLRVPVEVKSGNHRQHPRPGHILQLGAYCLLVEDKWGARPPYGLLHYADGTLRIAFTDQLRGEVLAAIAAIQKAADAPNMARNHRVAARCHQCGYAHGCGAQALTNK